MDAQDRQDGNVLVLVRGLSSTMRVAQKLPAIVFLKETHVPSCSSMLVPLSKASFWSARAKGALTVDFNSTENIGSGQACHLVQQSRLPLSKKKPVAL